MRFTKKRWVLFLSFVMLLSSFRLYGVDSYITNGRTILAYGSDQAYLINTLNEMYRWDPVTLKWQLYTILTPDVRQLDCWTDGTNVIATDNDDKYYEWNGQYGFSSSWSQLRNPSRYDWVLHDPITYKKRGKRKGLGGAWEEWGTPPSNPGDPWNKYLPAGPKGELKTENFYFIDRNAQRFHRWERDDVGYMETLNKSGESTPFHIFYFGLSEEGALSRITDPPYPTHNIEDVFVKQISYDERHQNLWCVDQDGIPWQWDNVTQQWIKRDIRGDEGFIPVRPETEVTKLLRVQDDFYVRTTYIQGDYKPVIIIFKDTMVLHFILGELSRSNMEDAQIYIFEQRKPDHKFHTILRLPKETPQKIVRIDGGKRIRENHYLERLLQLNGVITGPDAIGVYPAEHRIIRR